MTLQELSAMITNGFEPMVEVHSIDPSIYLIFCCINDQRQPLLTSAGDTLKCRSRSAPLDQLRETGLHQADFVHRNAYDEMIGFSHDNRPTEHRETVKLQPLPKMANG